jgi:hypothetical protein
MAAGTGLHLWPTLRRHTPKRELRVVDDQQFAILAAVAARMVSVPGVDPAELAHRVDETLSLGPPEVGADFRKLLGLLESGLAGLLLDGRPRPFTRLDGDAQDKALLAFRDSRMLPRRSGFRALRQLCQAAHYAEQGAWAPTGYPGPPALTLPADYKATP